MSFTNPPLTQNVAGGLGGRADEQLAREALRNQVQPSPDIMVSRTSRGTFLRLRKGEPTVVAAAEAKPATKLFNLDLSGGGFGFVLFEAYPNTMPAGIFGGYEQGSNWGLPIPSMLANQHPDDVSFDSQNNFAWPKIGQSGNPWRLSPPYTDTRAGRTVVGILISRASIVQTDAAGTQSPITYIDVNIEGRRWSHI